MDTIVAPITPLVKSSVITVRISGENAYKVKKFLFVNGKPLDDIKERYVYYGTFKSENVQDECIFYFFKGPYSFTGEDVVEISFHGNPLLVHNAIKDIYSVGIRLAEPGEFSKRAFLNGKLDLVQAEAIFELIESKSIHGIKHSYVKLKTGMKDELDVIRDMLIDVLSVVEAYVDFPEEDLGDYELNYVLNRMDILIEKLNRLIKSFEMSRFEREGVRVAIVGKPNVGKSSLMNFLLNKNRVIVSEVPGTTRDVIEEELYIGGYPVKIIDTAGIRESEDEIERMGIDISVKKIEEADIILAVFDLSRPFDKEDEYFMEMLKGKNNVIYVGNKKDIEKFSHEVDVKISVKQKKGFDELISLIEKRVKEIVLVVESDSVLINERQMQIFSEMVSVLEKVKSEFASVSLDLLAIDLQYCLSKISEITGKVYTEEILDNVFGKFCIGK